MPVAVVAAAISAVAISAVASSAVVATKVNVSAAHPGSKLVAELEVGHAERQQLIAEPAVRGATQLAHILE